jgi:tRNA U34 5-methylaminomethyl-2-thiouridine-forming methyltransferase MnmC
LNYPTLLDMHNEFSQLHNAHWNEWHLLNEFFSFRKLQTTVQEAALPGAFDLIYFDAFAPSRQPEMWSTDVIAKIVKLLTPQGVLVTYCARGQLKRDFMSFGLKVETLQGPPGKKEMVRVQNF